MTLVRGADPRVGAHQSTDSHITGSPGISSVVRMTDSMLVVWDVAELPLQDLNALLRASKRWALIGGPLPTACLDALDDSVDEEPRDAEQR